MFYVYLLRSEKDQKFYTGYTKNLKERFERHKDGRVFSTKYRGELKLIYFEGCLNETDAKKRERYLKSGSGKRYLRNRLKYFLNKGPGPVRSTVVNRTQL